MCTCRSSGDGALDCRMQSRNGRNTEKANDLIAPPANVFRAQRGSSDKQKTAMKRTDCPPALSARRRVYRVESARTPNNRSGSTAKIRKGATDRK